MTNQEWLATLPPEELGKLLDVSCSVCVHRELRHCDYCSDNCIENRKDWLSKKHKEDSDNAKS